MAEAVDNAAGLGLPIVMTLGNRAIGAPINIWNDHSDAMSMRDAGWLQLFAEFNRDFIDLHIQAFRLAEELSMPVMVCVDGFILTHAVERVDIPDQADVDAFLPPYEPVQVLDPAAPISIGAMVGPDAFTEVRFLQHYKQTLALRLIPEFAADFKEQFGRDTGGLLRTYHAIDAEMLAGVAMGSINGTIKDVIDEMRADGFSIGLVTIVSFRPFPTRRCAGCWPAKNMSSWSKRALRSVWAASSPTMSIWPCATRRPRRRSIRWSLDWAAARSRGRRCSASSAAP